MIPKIIHYCWLSSNPFPDKLQEYMNTWKKNLPDYEFVLWDTNRFNINSCLWTKQAFENKKYAFAADYIRLYAVYHYGGIYLDMDVEVIKSFNPLLSQNTILGMEIENGIEAGIFGAEKHAKWLKDCLEYYKDRPFILPDGQLDMRPLPTIMYEITKKYIYRGEIPVLTKEYFTAKSCKTGKITCTDNTYTIHHFAGSWLTPWMKIKANLSSRLGKKTTNLLKMNIVKVKNIFKQKI